MCQKGFIFEGGSDYAFAECRDSFGDFPDEPLVREGKKKWAEKGTMHTVAEGHLGGTEFVQEFVRKIRRFGEQIVEQPVPRRGGIHGAGCGFGSGDHFCVGPAGGVVAGAFGAEARVEPGGGAMGGFVDDDSAVWGFGEAEGADVATVAAPAAAANAPGAPTKPEAAPTLSISSQRGHGSEAAPWRARSMTRRVIFSTTCSK